MGAREELLRPLKQRIYVVILALALTASVLALVVNELTGLSPAHVRYSLLASSAVSAVLIWLIYTGKVPLRVVEELFYAGVGIIFLAVLFSSLYLEDNPQQVQISLLGFHPWLPCFYVLIFLIYESRAALVRSVVFYLLAFAGSLPYALSPLISGVEPNHYVPLEQMYFANAVIIAMLFFFARLKERLREVEVTAKRMTRLAQTDPLTGIANRRRIEEALDREVEAAAANSHRLALITFDIDNFKQVNDAFGHDVGDELLVEVTRAVRPHLRAGDHFGRWGGEEFIIVAPEMSLENAWKLANRIRSVLEDHDFDPAGTLSASFGVSEFRPGDSRTTLVKRADVAVYRAKTGGKNRVEAEPKT
jgi:diguanylate cyclase (GGDEF)-like protein